MNSRRFIDRPHQHEEMATGYQINTIIASECCIAMRRRTRGLFRVDGVEKVRRER